MIFLYIAAALIVLVLIVTLICFNMTFYSGGRNNKKKGGETSVVLASLGDAFAQYKPQMKEWALQTRAMSYRELTATSYDGLTLRGRFYELSPDAPVELMFHGYRGCMDRDLCGAVIRAHAVGHSALLVDHRSHGTSDGCIITFGYKEQLDVPVWLEVIRKELGDHRKVILTGISMGATTVLLAAGQELPEQVVGVLADCGYNRAKDIIQCTMRGMKVPVGLLYPFVRLSAIMYGGFDLEKVDVTEAMKRCRVPVLFYHGAADGFVPCEMGRKNYEACAAPCRFVEVPGADHGLSYPADPEGYVAAAKEFAQQYWYPEKVESK